MKLLYENTKICSNQVKTKIEVLKKHMTMQMDKFKHGKNVKDFNDLSACVISLFSDAIDFAENFSDAEQSSFVMLGENLE